MTNHSPRLWRVHNRVEPKQVMYNSCQAGAGGLGKER